MDDYKKIQGFKEIVIKAFETADSPTDKRG